ncbi:hypothetical protein KQI22_01735 [Kineothrix sp. MSJ-39]|nr:hypothetical protein [Kineothrix sp. MSJ-39]
MLSDSDFRRLVNGDLKACGYKNTYRKKNTIIALSYMLLFDTTFRAQYYYRLKYYKHDVLFYVSKMILKNKKDIDLWGDIGSGLSIFHGQGCVIVLNKAGKNLNIYQGVTVGKNPKTEINGIATPSFGDNVCIYANAVVIGNIKIGSNVKIGAGAVVNKDVPDNCTVVGNPMRIIMH